MAAKKHDDMGLSLISEALKKQDAEKETGTEYMGKKKTPPLVLRARSNDDDDDEQYRVPETTDTGDDDDEQYRVQTEAPTKVEPGYGETTFDALLQGLSLGFSDELASGIQAPFSDKSYRELQEERQRSLRAERLAHPALYNTAELSGAIGGSFIPGIGWVSSGGKILKGAVGLSRLANLMKIGAIGGMKQGIVQGWGRSEFPYFGAEDPIKGLADAIADTIQHGSEGALGGAIGAPIGAGLMHGAAKIGSGAGGLIKKGVSKFAEWTGPLLFNLKANVARHLAEHPEIYEKIKDMDPDTAQGYLAKQLTFAVNNLSAQVKAAKDKAIGKLNDDATIPVKDVIENVRKTFHDTFKAITHTVKPKTVITTQPKFLEVTDAAGNVISKTPNPDAGKKLTKVVNAPHRDSPSGVEAIKKYDSLIRMIQEKARDGLISEKDVGKIQDVIEDFIDRNPKTKDVANNAFKVAKETIGTHIKNAGYKNDMVPIAADTKALEDISRHFNLERTGKSQMVPGQYPRYQPNKNQTKGILNSLHTNVPAQEILRPAQTKYNWDDFINYAEAIRNQPNFDVRKPSWGGLAGMITGATTGALKGGLMAGIPGAALMGGLGIARDIGGPKAMRGILNATPLKAENVTGDLMKNVFSGEMTNPIMNPYYLGGPGETAAQWRARMEAEQRARDEAAALTGNPYEQ